MGSVCVGPDIQLRLGPHTHMDFQQGNSVSVCFVLCTCCDQHQEDIM